MKWSIPILMLLTLTMTFSKGMLWLEYQANKDYISQNLCINKAKPKLHCNGKCQMMKKLAEEEKENSPAPAQKHRLGFDESELPGKIAFNLFVKEIKTEQTHFFQHSNYASPVFPVFHPPA